jgi:hypothetical protein
MGKTRQYNIEGMLLEILLCYDELTGKEIENFPDFIENPVYTPDGCPILFTGEDACEYGEPKEGESCLDCGSCRFYRQVPNSLLGVCKHKKKHYALDK